MLGMVVLGLALAMMYRFWLVKFKNLIRTITFFPVILPTVAVGQLFRKIYEIQPNYGLLNSILDAVGLHDQVQAWIGQASTALGCLSVMDIWVSVGFYAVIFYGGLIDIPDDVIEAAKVDGCNPGRCLKILSFRYFVRLQSHVLYLHLQVLLKYLNLQLPLPTVVLEMQQQPYPCICIM